jgi:6-phosphogluconolactonase
VVATRWHVHADADALAERAAQVIARVAAEATARRGVFKLVLAGGNTPAAIYGRLRGLPLDWSRWELWFGDERCVPRGDPQRNDRMADNALLAHVPIPAGQVHRIATEGSVEEAAAAYAAEADAAGVFDLVLLGLGEDGHTASLFPGHPDGSDAAAVAVRAAPKPPPQRVSLSARRLSLSRQAMFLVTGGAKAAAVRAWAAGVDIPAARIAPADGVDVWLDASAAQGLCAAHEPTDNA